MIFFAEKTVDFIGNLHLRLLTSIHGTVALYSRSPAQAVTLADSSFRLASSTKHPFISFDPKKSFLCHLLSTNRLTNN